MNVAALKEIKKRKEKLRCGQTGINNKSSMQVFVSSITERMASITCCSVFFWFFQFLPVHNNVKAPVQFLSETWQF